MYVQNMRNKEKNDSMLLRPLLGCHVATGPYVWGLTLAGLIEVEESHRAYDSADSTAPAPHHETGAPRRVACLYRPSEATTTSSYLPAVMHRRLSPIDVLRVPTFVAVHTRQRHCAHGARLHLPSRRHVGNRGVHNSNHRLILLCECFIFIFSLIYCSQFLARFALAHYKLGKNARKTRWSLCI